MVIVVLLVTPSPSRGGYDTGVASKPGQAWRKTGCHGEGQVRGDEGREVVEQVTEPHIEKLPHMARKTGGLLAPLKKSKSQSRHRGSLLKQSLGFISLFLSALPSSCSLLRAGRSRPTS